jgi:hypothetical protein
MVCDINHVCDLSIDFQFVNMFCCSILILLLGKILLVLEALAYDERISPLGRDTIF